VVQVIPKIKAFQKEGMVVKTVEYMPAGKVLSLRINQNDEGGKEENIFHRSLRIVSYNGRSILLRQRFKARGGTAADAKTNAKAASLEVVQMDSSLIFNEELKVDPAFPFRAQEVEMILYLPRGQRFKMDSRLFSMLENPEIAGSEIDRVEYSEDDGEGTHTYRYFREWDEEAVWTLRGAVLVPADETEASVPDSTR
jgi:uncharacterized protein YkuJ